MPHKTAPTDTINAFYLFAADRYHHQKKSEVIKINLKKSASHVDYAMIKIPVTHRNLLINNEQFTVIENHISVFSTYLNPKKDDEYHFTATLINSSGEEYKLRCYFNLRNEPIGELTFKKTSLHLAEQEEHIELDIHIVPILKMLIQAETDKVILPLSKMQQQKFTTLIHQLETKVDEVKTQYFLNVESTSLSIVNNLIEQTKKLLREEKKIIQIAPKYGCAPLQFLKETLEWRKAEILTQTTQEAQVQQQALMDKSKITTAQVIKSSIPHASTKKKKKKKGASSPKNPMRAPASIGIDIEKAMERFETLKNQHLFFDKSQRLTQQATQLRELSSQISLLSLETSELKQSQHHLLELQLIHQSLASTLIHQAIRDDDIDAIKVLTFYTNLAPNEILQFAIDMDDAALLTDILNQHSYAINRIQLTHFDSQQEVSLLIYAYENRASHAFEVLLDNGANPFISWQQDLPLIHHILKNKADGIFYPLMFEKVYKLGKTAILTQLINMLESAKNSNTYLSTQGIAELDKSIMAYQANLSLTMHASKKSQKRIVRSGATIISHFANMLPASLHEAVNSDEEFLQIQSDYIQTQNQFCNELSATELNRFNVIGKELLSESFSNEAISKNSMTPALVKQILKCHTELLPKISRQLTLQKICNNPRSKGAAVQITKESNKLALEINKIKAELSALTQPHDATIARESFLDVLTALKSQLNSIKDYLSEDDALENMAELLQSKLSKDDSPGLNNNLEEDELEFPDGDFLEVAMDDEGRQTTSVAHLMQKNKSPIFIADERGTIAIEEKDEVTSHASINNDI